jgi:nitrogenase molybdenum-iron protein beta chain
MMAKTISLLDGSAAVEAARCTIAENPRFSCALGGALPTVGAIHRAVPILHAGPGCGMQLFNGQNYVAAYQGYGYAGGSSVPSTNTYEREVVFGGEGRLRQIIGTTLDVIDADLFVLLTGCTAEIIGDDIKAVVADFAGSSVPIAFAETGGFKGNTYFGYDAVIDALAQQVVEPDVEREPRTVNIFGIVPSQDLLWQGNLEEIARLLSGIGLKVNTFLTGSQGLDRLRRSSAAALNIVLSPYLAQAALETYESRFGTPSLRYPGVPIGPTATVEFLELVAERLGLDAEAVRAFIDAETAYTYEYFDKSSLVVTGFSFQHRFAVIGDSATVIGVTRFLTNDFGQLPAIAVITDEPPEEAREEIVRAVQSLEYGDPPPVLFLGDLWSISDAVRQVAPTYILGSSLDKDLAQDLGALHQSVSFPATDRLVLNRAYAGFRGSITLVEDFLAPGLVPL